MQDHNKNDDNKENTSEVIPFVTENGETLSMYVLEETTLQGVHYILVTDDLSEDSDEAIVVVLKEDPDYDEDEYSLYHLVEDDTELNAIVKVFAELMEDVDFEI